MLGISYEKFYNKDLLGKTFKEKVLMNWDTKLFLSANVKQVSNVENRDFTKKYRHDFESSVNTHVIFHSTVTKLNF